MQITEGELSSVRCNDISIQKLPNGKDFLILICETKDDSNRLIDLLNQNPFVLKVEANGNYALSIEFVESKYGLKIVTEKNETNYPPVKKIKNNQIAFITTGVWTGRSAQGRQCEYHQQMLRLGERNIGEAFSQANAVHFVAGERDKSPSAVVLIYENWGHIAQAEAMEAFNELMLRSKGNPKLEIVANGTFASLRIWDILIDLEVKFQGLKYLPTQLAEFLNETDPKHSFGFVLGFPPQGSAKAALAAKKEGPQIITLKGYVYKGGN